MTTESIKGYDKIGEFGRQVFNSTHKAHLSVMGIAEREKYQRDQVKSVKANNTEGCIEVRFRNGELFKYTPSGRWY